MAVSLRTETAGLVRLAELDLAQLWALISEADARTVLNDLLPALIVSYGAAGATLAADWYDEQRVTVAAKRRFTAEPVIASPRAADSLIAWALSEATSDESLRVLILGGMQRRIADHVRETIIGSSLRDPAADGWQRVGSGECDFCRMLIGRVYSESTVRFGAHDNCNCSAVPAFGGEPRPVKPYERSASYIEDDEKRAAQNARTRAWMRNNGY